jgi:hypothetical protein
MSPRPIRQLTLTGVPGLVPGPGRRWPATGIKR